jgi:hypothetical protein
MNSLLNDAPNYLSGAGLVWDIAGAYLLARGLWVNDRSIFDLAASGWGFTSAIVRSGCEHRLDTKFGLWLLIGGFGIQAVSSVLVKVDFEFSMWIALLVVLPLSWLGAHYKVWVLGDTLRVLKLREQGGIQEATLRKTFSDYPDRIWKMVVINSGYEFAAPPP